MTQEVAGALVDLPDDWFEKEQRSLDDVRFRLERKRRELDVREAELEARTRDLHERGERLRESFRTAQETSQDLMARSHRLREQQGELAASQASLEKDWEALSAARRDEERRVAEVGTRETQVAAWERRLREREALVGQPGAGSGPAPREVEPRPATTLTPGAPWDGAAILRHLLSLKEELETTIARVRSREGEAQSLLAQVGERAARIRAVEESIQNQERRLEGTRLEIVNAKRALLSVDQALLRMPYEIVDTFTKTAEFEEYERALRVLKRFEESPGRGS